MCSPWVLSVSILARSLLVVVCDGAALSHVKHKCSHARLPSDGQLQSVLRCSHARLPWCGGRHVPWCFRVFTCSINYEPDPAHMSYGILGRFEDPARCEPRLLQSASCCFRLVIRTIAGVALVVCVMEQLCHT